MVILISIIAIRILVKVIKISNIHSTLLAFVGSFSATVKSSTYSADGARVPLVHLGVPPCYAIFTSLTLGTWWLSRLLPDCTDSVCLVRLRLVANRLIVIYILH